MTIAHRVTQASERVLQHDYEGALFQICSAIEATASSEYGQSGRGAYMRLIRENLELITRVAFRHHFANMSFGMDLNRFRPSDDQLKPNSDGSFSIEQILYHVVRCDLYHNAGLPEHIEFCPGTIMSCEVDKIRIPGSIVNGLVVAVVASPANVGQVISDDLMFDFLVGVKICLNKFWGKRDALRAMLTIVDQLGP